MSEDPLSPLRRKLDIFCIIAIALFALDACALHPSANLGAPGDSGTTASSACPLNTGPSLPLLPLQPALR